MYTINLPAAAASGTSPQPSPSSNQPPIYVLMHRYISYTIDPSTNQPTKVLSLRMDWHGRPVSIYANKDLALEASRKQGHRVKLSDGDWDPVDTTGVLCPVRTDMRDGVWWFWVEERDWVDRRSQLYDSEDGDELSDKVREEVVSVWDHGEKERKEKKEKCQVM
ncbi:hypothetical protein BCR34DRAFT_601610 [Clohesyomyces aquaticus]|uniref:Uncharacterized protein n=1 Tax=Clohesyomyces aquaticus TaxID=1231657 RepID=A0A1Y1ZLL6_9PLEO|nr:hypothetical protein BCR34DRAFT_601610 [Clohesyomyces aquaticus]